MTSSGPKRTNGAVQTPVSPARSLKGCKSPQSNAPSSRQLDHLGSLPSPADSLLEFTPHVSNPNGGGLPIGKMEVSTCSDEFGTKLFQHALAQMQQDKTVMEIREATMKSSRMKTSSKKQPIRKVPYSRAKKGPPIHSLAAAHPVLYQQQAPVPMHHLTAHDKKMQPAQDQRDASPQHCSIPPWQVYTDPKRLLSHEPRFPDPMHRMLKMDVNVDQPIVISPVFMLGLPCGGMLEAAHLYDD